MKAIDTNQEHCNQELLSRYHDDELATLERQQVEAHLEKCPACQSTLARFARMGRIGRRHTDRAVAALDAAAMSKRILARRPIARETSMNWRSWFKPSRLFLPVAVTAMALAIYIIPHSFRTKTTHAAPSAIINSFTGSVTSVMFYETPNTHQTIIWISEDAIANGEDDAV
jgi:anti-sigma factor RsiW